MNIVGINIGKWLQNGCGVGSYVPLLLLIGAAVAIWWKHGSATHFTWSNIWPVWNWDTVNFWPQIAFAFTGLELASAMSDEIRDPRRTLARATWVSALLIAVMYISGTGAVLVILDSTKVYVDSGAYQALTAASVVWKLALLGLVAAFL